MWKQVSSRMFLVPFLLLLVLCSTLLQSSPGLAVSSVPSPRNERSLPPSVIVARARQWVAAQVPYSQRVDPAYRFQNYRADCSGLVSMAWGIPATPPNYGLSTTTLSLVADLLGKALDASGTPNMSTMSTLQTGDILLNQGTDAHVILFVGWIDITAKQVVNHPVLNNDGNYYYDGIEENGSAGKNGIGDGAGQAIEHTPDHPLHSAPFDYNQPWPYPYYPGYNSQGYYAWRFDAAKAAKLNLSPAPAVKPGGLWITPKNGDSVTDVIHFAAQAYPTHQGDPAIFFVYFTINSNGSWMVACSVAPPVTGNMFACDVNLKDLGVPYGQIQLSFDVYDQAGNVNYAPNGVHTLTYAPSPGTTPVPPTPVQRTLTLQQTQSQAVNATGQGTTPGISASGMLTVYNFDPNTTNSFSAGQTFSNGLPTPIQMVLDADVSVPPPPPGVFYSTAMVPGHVIPVGTIGNIPKEESPQGFKYSTNDSNGHIVQIQNDSPFTGGQDPQTYAVVKQSDIDTAANSLKTSTRQSAVADLNSQLRPNEHLVGDPQCTYDTTSDYAAGEKATTVTVTVKATCTATAST
jgi:hypothetical protein